MVLPFLLVQPSNHRSFYRTFVVGDDRRGCGRVEAEAVDAVRDQASWGDAGRPGAAEEGQRRRRRPHSGRRQRGTEPHHFSAIRQNRGVGSVWGCLLARG